MPAKIRLARHGRKRNAIYHIVVADSRAPRDGKYIERLGQYDPNTNPASIVLDFDKALDWLQKGAQPTDTCRSILSQKGVMMKKHLLEGVKKGAFDEAEALNRFDKWLADKEAKLQATADKIQKSKEDEATARLEAETRVKEAKAAELAKKKAAEEAEAAAAEAPEEEAAETEAAAEEAPAEETPVAEAPVEETPAEEAPAEEAAAPAAEQKKEEPAAEEEKKEDKE